MRRTYKIASLLAMLIVLSLHSSAEKRDSLTNQTKDLKVQGPVVDTTLLHKTSNHIGDTLVFEDYEDPTFHQETAGKHGQQQTANASQSTHVIQEIIKSDEWMIFPNPSKGDFSVKIDFFNPYTRAIIRDMEGRIVLKIENSITEISSFAQGIYWVEINHQDYREIRKVIVN